MKKRRRQQLGGKQKKKSRKYRRKTTGNLKGKRKQKNGQGKTGKAMRDDEA
jgi:hypothetical protein